LWGNTVSMVEIVTGFVNQSCLPTFTVSYNHNLKSLPRSTRWGLSLFISVLWLA
jgi:hypothetical protein